AASRSRRPWPRRPFPRVFPRARRGPAPWRAARWDRSGAAGSVTCCSSRRQRRRERGRPTRRRGGSPRKRTIEKAPAQGPIDGAAEHGDEVCSRARLFFVKARFFFLIVAALVVCVPFAPPARAANDPRLLWQTIETPHFRITFESQSREVAERV